MNLYKAATAAALATALVITGTQAGAAPAAATADQQLPLPAMQALIDEAASKGEFAGTVLIARNGKPVLESSHGIANRETGEPNSAETQFGLASLDKFITRLAIFQLLQAGKLQLSDSVGKILADIPNEELKTKVSVQQLLDMKAGVPSFWNDRYFATKGQLRTTNDYLDLFVREPLRFEPGTKREYSNGGFIVLGAIVERLSGLSYEDYVRKHITGPAGMRKTGLFPNGAVSPGRAIGYTRASAGPVPGGARQTRDQGSASAGGGAGREAALRPNLSLLPFRGSPAGGGYSTSRDLLALDRAIRADKLLKPRFTDLFLQGSFRQGLGSPTGWNGGTPGHNVQFIMYPDGTTLIVLANQDPPAATKVAAQLARLMGKTINLG